MKENKYTTRESIKSQLKKGDYELISSLTKGQYAIKTVMDQMNGVRTLKQPVIDAANKLIAMREELLTA